MRARTTPMPTSSTGWCTVPQCAFSPFSVGGCSELERCARWVPHAVANGLARMPVEPPVHHLAGDSPASLYAPQCSPRRLQACTSRSRRAAPRDRAGAPHPRARARQPDRSVRARSPRSTSVAGVASARRRYWLNVPASGSARRCSLMALSAPPPSAPLVPAGPSTGESARSGRAARAARPGDACARRSGSAQGAARGSHQRAECRWQAAPSRACDQLPMRRWPRPARGPATRRTATMYVSSSTL